MPARVEPSPSPSAPPSYVPVARVGRPGLSESLTAALLCTVLTFVLLGGLTVGLWHYERVAADQAIASETRLLRTQVARQLSYLMSDEFAPIRHFKREIPAQRMTPEAFESAAALVRESMPFVAMMAWIDREGVVQAAAGEAGKELVGRDLRNRGEMSQLLPPARTRWREGIEAYVIDGEHLVGFFSPMAAMADGRVRYVGGVVVEMQLAGLIDRLLDAQTREWFTVVLHGEDEQIIYASGDSAASAHEHEPVTVMGETWFLEMIPTTQFLASKAQHWRMLALWAGLAVSAIAAGAVWQAMYYRRHDRHLTRTYIGSLHALNEVAAAVSNDGKGSVRELLERLTEAGADFLGMSKCVIALYDERTRVLQVVYRRGINQQATQLRDRYQIDELLGSKTCLETAQIVYDDDVERDESVFDKQVMRAHDVRSLLVIPMIINGEKIGTITLADERPKKFTDLELRMASLWGSQTAVTIVNHHLYQRMERSMRSQNRLLSQLETLYRVNTLIYQAHSAADALHRIVDLAPGALEFDLCVVCLANHATQRLKTAAVTSTPAALTDAVSGIEQCLHRAQVLENRRAIIVRSSSGDAVERTYLPSGVGSALYLPLIGSDQSNIGVLALLRQADSHFSPQRVRVAELFAGRAAIAIENTRLYEQTQRDAETMTMLLRELNHRVKNNLAGIGGLLAMRPPDLSADATEWLDRVTDRISTISRVHDLFSGGLSVVGLRDLIDTALESVKAIKPLGVELRVDLEAPEVQLPTDRAVTLAMVVHELCYNAVVHGAGANGSIVLRSRMLPAERMAIQVIDSGAGALAAAGARGNGNGRAGSDAAGPGACGRMGLGLVRGLVGRELRGEFAYQTNEQGGVTATVDFPISAIDFAKE